MTEITVALGERSYPIEIGIGTLDRLRDAIKSLGVGGKAAIITDSNVGPLYAERAAVLIEGSGLECTVCTLPAGEEHKRLAQVEALCGEMLEGGLDRSSVVIALGGGVVGDVAGFTAAVFMRGIPYVQIPTTIVAQVDSSVGGKTAVNHPLSKNSIGAFHQPAAVIVDMSLLETLPERELRAGLAEAIKHGIIADAELFTYMETHARAILAKDLAALEKPIVRSCEIKAAIVAADEREQGARANLNYGHTFGHAIETVTDYRGYLHGEAIALGMVCAARLSRTLGLVDEAFEERQRSCLAAYGLPVSWPDIPIDETIHAMKRDKKIRAGTMKFILADRFGHVVQQTDVPDDAVREALTALRN